MKLFEKRSLRVRNRLKKTGFGKCRLSVHRSSKNIPPTPLATFLCGIKKYSSAQFLNFS